MFCIAYKKKQQIFVLYIEEKLKFVNSGNISIYIVHVALHEEIINAMFSYKPLKAVSKKCMLD